MQQILVRPERCLGCKNCELACSVAHSSQGELFTALSSGEQPIRRVRVETNATHSINLPIQCRQCSEPKCVQACMTGAMQRDEQSGLVVNHQEKCVGCWMCVMVCPYGVIVPSEGHKVALKCDQCFTLDRDPACVQACPTKALKFESIPAFERRVRQEYLTRFLTGEEA
ncbi:MAG: 4Fe-4S dicluster domain-containing protein [Peptococcaceae bacterium]|nr:4Fe-4S dicluster domain-containing protein [Peptococcaceae bacterium]